MSNQITTVPKYLDLPAGPQPRDPFVGQLVDSLNRQNSRISDAVTSMLGVDVLANRPLTPLGPALFYATDAAHLYVWNGSAWVTLI